MLTWALIFVALVQISFEQTTSSQCDCPGSEYTSDVLEAEIKSPIGPGGMYCNMLECTYTIEAGDPGTAIRLHFERLDTEENHDYVQVTQVEQENKFPMQKISGSYHGEDFVSAEGNGFELFFRSDGSVRRSGFVARFTRFNITEQQCACPSMFYSASSSLQSIASPNSPNKYCNRMMCYYNIRATPPLSVRLQLSSIDMDGTDSIKVFEGESNSTSRTNYLLTWSGRTLGAVTSSGGKTEIISRSHGLIVVFHSDSTSGGTGFTADYQQTQSPCDCRSKKSPTRVPGGQQGFLTSPAYPLTYCDNLDCTYPFSTDMGYVMQYEINAFSTERGHDWLYMLDTENGQREMAQHSGGMPNPDRKLFTSNGRTSAVKFKSDSSIISRGFNLTYRSVLRNRDCKCPTPMPKTYSSQSGNIQFVQKKLNCGFMDCLFTLHPPGPLHRLNLNISTKTISPFGSLTMYNGLIPSGGWLEQFDKYTTGQKLVTVNSERGVTLHYHSEASNSATIPDATGFNVTWEWKPRCQCGPSALTADTDVNSPKIITSPDHPSSYCNSMDCKWSISAPSGYRVVIQMQEFRTENNEDFLSIYNGFDTNDHSKRIRRLTGMVYHMDALKSNREVMTLWFKSDPSITYNGFKAKYYKESYLITSTTERASPTPIIVPTTTKRPTTSSSTRYPTTTTRRTTRKPVTAKKYEKQDSNEEINPVEMPETSGRGPNGWAVFAVVMLVLVAIGLAVFIFLYSTGRVSLARFGIGTTNTSVGYTRDVENHASGSNGAGYSRFESSKISLMEDNYD